VKKIEAKIETKIFHEFFIVGVNKDRITSDTLKNEIPQEPETLFMFNH
jgi:hypothetical protein